MKIQTITQATTIVASNSILLAAAASIRGSGSGSGRALGLFDGSARIIGGDPAVEDRYPYAVSLSDDLGHFCGGSLIARDVVLTAAHCDEKGAGQYKAVVGRHAHTDNDGQELSVKLALPHPNYDAYATDKDFLLIFLNEAASDNINIVRLNSDADTPNVSAPVTVMGWGDIDPTDAGQVLASELMEVEVNVISNEECDSSDGSSGSYKDSITSNMLCAREEGGGEDSCQGDSGGPLVIKGANASGDVQVGVVSWGIGCASKDYPGVYARVSAQYEWIRSEVCDKSNFAPSELDCSNAAPPSSTTTTSTSSPNDSNNNANFPTWQPTLSPSESDNDGDDWTWPTWQPTQSPSWW